MHGYSDEFLSKQKKFSDVAEEFLKFIENKKLVIHNASFDLSHLNNELVLLGKKINQDVVVDTLEMARKNFQAHRIVSMLYVRDLELIIPKEKNTLH